MKTKIKISNRILSFVLALAMVAVMLPMNILAASADTTAVTGSCGTNATWEFDSSTNTLTISGSGAMEDIEVIDGTTESPWDAYMEQITSVVVKDGITHIGNYSFSEHYNLTNVSLPPTLTSIGTDAFSYTALTEIALPEGLQSIGNRAFRAATLLNVVIPNSVKEIGGMAFSYCQSLTDVKLPQNENFTTISHSLFLYSTNLEKVTIPSSVTKIESYAFDGSGITTVYMSGNAPTVFDTAFDGAPEGLTVYVSGANASGYEGGAWDKVNVVYLDRTTKPIYFDNSIHWSNVNAYYWSDSDSTMIAWPGEAMTLVEGETAIYSVEVPAEAQHIIFNDGSTQTFNLTIPTDGKNLYDFNTNEWTTYDDGTSESTVEAKWGADADSLTNAGTLADAIAAAEGDSTIRYIQLQSDVSGSFIINAGTFTIDLNGKTITSNTYTIDARNSGTVVTLTDSVSGGAVNSTGVSCSAVVVTDSGKVVINGGSYYGEFSAVWVESNEATVSISNGSFSGNEVSVYTMGVTTVIGGTFGSGTYGTFRYLGGMLDLSGYAGTVTDLKVSNGAGADLVVTDENIKLPAGYTFADSEGNAVTTLTLGTVYSIAPEVVKYPVDISADITGGTVTADKASAAEGETVTLTVTPDDGYLLFALLVMQGDTLVEVSDNYSFAMPSGNVTITALFEQISYSVTWSDGDGASYLKTFKYGEVITIPTNEFFEDTFRRGGYTLKGWQGYTEGMTMPRNDVTFVAVYTPNQYTVEFDANGGESIAPITVTFGDKYGRLPSSAITGLSGGDSNWFLVDEDGNVTETNIKNLTLVSTYRDHKLFIKRKVLAPNVSITLTVPGGISDGYQYYIPGASQRVLTATVKNGNTELLNYTYQWYKDGTLIEGATSDVLTLDGNVADAGTYKVKVTATLKDESDIIVTENTASAEKEQVVKIMHAANTLYYDANGGEGGPSSNYTGGTDITVQTGKPTREGYIFGGWNTKADGTGESYDGGATYTFENDNGNGGCSVTLYAQWIKTYDVYVGGVQVTSANAGNVLGDGKVSYDAETATLTLTDAAINNADGIGIKAAGDLTISGSGRVTGSTYGIYVDGRLSIVSGSVIEMTGTENCALAVRDGILTDNIIVSVPKNYALGSVGEEDHTTYGTYIEENDEYKFIPAKTVKFEPGYIIYFDVGESMDYIEYQEIVVGGKVERPADPTLSGYIFGGWYIDEAYTVAYDFDTPVTEDLWLYAKWVPVALTDTFTVTYKADGVTIDTQTVGHGEDAVLPSVPKKDGYVGKWDHDGINITANTEINAVYTAVSGSVPENLKPEDKTELEDTKKTLEEELKNDIYSEDEKKAIKDEIKRIDDALEVIGNVEAVEELIDKLPENITKNDEAAIKAADDAYNALTDYEKSLVDEDAKKALDDAKAALAELNKPTDSDSPQTGDNSNLWMWFALLFVSGTGLFGITLYDRKRRMATKR